MLVSAVRCRKAARRAASQAAEARRRRQPAQRFRQGAVGECRRRVLPPAHVSAACPLLRQAMSVRLRQDVIDCSWDEIVLRDRQGSAGEVRMPCLSKIVRFFAARTAACALRCRMRTTVGTIADAAPLLARGRQKRQAVAHSSALLVGRQRRKQKIGCYTRQVTLFMRQQACCAVLRATHVMPPARRPVLLPARPRAAP